MKNLSALVETNLVTPDQEQTNPRDEKGRGYTEAEMAEEGEVVSEVLNSPSLLTHYKVRRRAQQGEVACHRADPCKYEPCPHLLGG